MKPLALCLAIVTLVSCRSTPAENAGTEHQEPTKVTTMTVARQPVPGSLEAGGVVHSATSATLASRTLASVTAVRVHPGDRVAAGDLLVQLDDRDLVAQQRRAEQTTTAAASAHTAAMADRDAASAGLALARTANDRISGLFARDSATTQERDEAAASLRSAQAHAAAADARVAQLEAEVSAAQQSTTAANVSASFAAVRAPFAGVIVERLVEPGDLVSPGTPLLRLEGSEAFRLEIPMDEARIPTLAPGARADVWIADATQPLEGRVSEIARSTSGGAHAFVVKVALPNASLRSGLYGRARFPLPARDMIALPRQAIVPQGQLTTTWVVVNARARRRIIAVGEATGADAVEVVAGLAVGEQVILMPPPQLRDGDPVAVTGGR